jgi:hypothetical protein
MGMDRRGADDRERAPAWLLCGMQSVARGQLAPSSGAADECRAARTVRAGKSAPIGGCHDKVRGYRGGERVTMETRGRKAGRGPRRSDRPCAACARRRAASEAGSRGRRGDPRGPPTVSRGAQSLTPRLRTGRAWRRRPAMRRVRMAPRAEQPVARRRNFEPQRAPGHARRAKQPPRHDRLGAACG